VSVSAVGADFMQDAGISDMVDVSVHVPSLTVSTNSSPWNTSYRIRRIGNEGNIPTFEPDTGLFIDGAYRSKSGMGLGDLVDIERIEVLKGPQSTLYGKNVTAGVIGITTSAPSEELYGMAEATVGEDAAFNVKGFVNGALADNVYGRISLSHSQRDPLIENINGQDADEMDSSSVRVQLLIEPSDLMSIRLIGGAVDREFAGPMGDAAFGPKVQAAVGAVQMGLFGPTDNIQPIALDNTMGNRTVNQPHGGTDFSQQSYEFTGIVTYDFERMTLTSITGYDEYDVGNNFHDASQSPLEISTFNDTTEGSSWSQELRLTSPGGETVGWMTGVFAYHNNFTRGDGTDREFVTGSDIDNFGLALSTAFPGTPLFLTPVLGAPGEWGDFYNEQYTDTLGVFGSVTWNISEKFAVTGGLRYNYEEKSAEMVTRNSGSASLLPQSLAGDTGLVGNLAPTNTWEPSDDWSAVTGNLTAEYFWNEDIMTYLTYARGFKAGGYNLGFGGGFTANDERSFDEEKVDSIELGWKTHLFDSRLQLNGAMFYTEYTDFQSAAFVGLSFNVNNAEKVNNYGFEFDGLYLLTESLTANFAASYVVAEYDTYTQGSCAFGKTPDVAGGYCDLSGEQLPFAPRWKANAGIQYETPVASGDFYGRLDVSWVDDHIPSSSLDERHEQEAYTLVNLKTGWRNAAWDASVWAKNLTDEDYAIQYAPDAALGGLVGGDGSSQVFMNTPRAIGATLRYNF